MQRHRLWARAPEILRLRFVTSYPRDFGDDILVVMARCPRICRYLHVPAQSGSNRILKLMNRGYTREQYREFIERVRAKAVQRGRVVYVDMSDAVVETVGKFVTYALYPESTYSLIVGRMSSGAKISVGYNPWSGKPRDADISDICVSAAQPPLTRKNSRRETSSPLVILILLMCCSGGSRSI